MKQKFIQARAMILGAQNILLTTHEDPDADALGSLLALKIALKRLGKSVSALLPSPIPRSLNFLPGFDEPKNRTKPPGNNLADIDLIIGLDYGDFKRLKIDPEELSGREFLTIDHHLIGQHLGYQIVANSSSTSEIIYQLLSFLEVPVDQEIATCLLTGIFSDTGGFRYANTSAQTLKIAGELLAKGAPLPKIAKAEKQFSFPKNLGLWSAVFENLVIDLKKGFLFSLVTRKKFPALDKEHNGSAIVSFLSTVPEIKFALLCTEKEPGRLDCSLRSQKKHGVNVAKIAQLFGGGGHRLAAGFQTTASPEKIIDAIKRLPLKNFLSS